MDFLPLMLLMNGMNGHDDREGGGIDNMISGLNRVKKFQNMDMSNPMDMMAGLMGDNNEMSSALNMIKMMGMAKNGGFGGEKDSCREDSCAAPCDECEQHRGCENTHTDGASGGCPPKSACFCEEEGCECERQRDDRRSNRHSPSDPIRCYNHIVKRHNGRIIDN